MSTKPSSIIKFLHTIENLKTTKRTGWLENNVNKPESISDHMYAAFELPFLSGDISPSQNIPKEEKHRLESIAMDQLFETLEGAVNPIAVEIKEIWCEYEKALTKEALFVKDIDKFEMILQCFEYEKRQKKKMECFFNSTRGKFQSTFIKSLVTELLAEREEFFSNLNVQ
ncbi:hypothetical protein HK099_003013 [Clydaea vesicula]|uniref:HD domain-containing protein n=1 Tax=Clydaea vesicula TaxID=447962 RepID=A0AAD5XWG7_9FUNG|nr:hypothetical protein HK099_003013 [Clydaea vesicula]